MSNRSVTCCVRGCPSKQEVGLSYFSLPVDLERRITWLQAIGRPDMSITDDLKPKNHVVCSVHFDDHQMSILKQTVPDAEPTRNVPRAVKGVFKTMSSIQLQTDFSSDTDDSDITYEGTDISDSDDSDDDETSKGKRKCGDVGNKSKKLKNYAANDDNSSSDFSYDSDDVSVSNDDGTKSNKSRNYKDNVVFIENESVNSQSVKTSIDYAVWNKFFDLKDRTLSRLKGKKLNEDFNMFALNLHTINRHGYKLLMGTWQLPSENELKAIDLRIGPRLDDCVMSLFSQKFKSLSRLARYCTIGLQVVALKNRFYYDAGKDELIGCHNANGVRTNEAASWALLATAQGIAVPWCQLVAFVLISNRNASEIIHEFITNLCAKLKKTGLQITGIVLPDDDWCHKYCSSNFVSPRKPTIRVDGEVLHIAFDMQQLLNSLRVDLLASDFVYKGNTVSHEYMKQAYEIDKEKGGILLPDLSDQHFQPDKKEKSFKYSYQLFSLSVASAITFYIEQGIIVEQARHTVVFLTALKNILDTLHLDKTTCDNAKNLGKTEIKALENFCVWIKNLKAIKNGEDVTKDTVSIQYLDMTLRSYINMCQELRIRNEKKTKCTQHLHLKPLQHFADLIKGDSNSKRLTPIQFIREFSKLFVKHLVELTPPCNSMGNLGQFLQMADSIKSCDTSYAKERIVLNNTDYRLDVPNERALGYVSSYLLYKISKAHNCREFNEYLMGLVDLNETKMNVHFEDLNREAAFYNHLKCPTGGFIEYVERLEDCFVKNFELFHRLHPASSFFDALKYVPLWDERCSCFPVEYLLKLFVRMRIYQTTIHNTNRLKGRSVAPTEYRLEVKTL